MSDRLGKVSAWYESGKRGSSAIGWDKVGGTSYGKYQIAAKVGTFDEFIKWVIKRGPLGEEVAEKLSCCIADGGKEGRVAKEWIKLAEEDKIQEFEYLFIKETHYDVAINSIKNNNTTLANLVNNYRALQEMLWSTSVQHGGPRAAKYFIDAYAIASDDLVRFIKEVYVIRSAKFKSSTEKVRKHIQDRYVDESTQLINMLNK